MMEEIRELVAMGFSLLDAKELVMADKKPSVTPTLSTKEVHQEAIIYNSKQHSIVICSLY